jgi:hypothetical protein
MTDSRKGPGGPPGPPWSVDVLADLHAGALDPAESARLWPLVNSDPQARAVLAALEEVTAGLGELGTAPVEPMPAQYAARLDAALAAEARSSGLVTAAPPQSSPQPPPPVAPVVDLAAARKRRNRMTAWGAGVLTAAAAAAAIAFVAMPGNETEGTPSAEGNGNTNTEEPGDTAPGGEGPLALSKNQLGKAIGPLTGKTDYGELENEQGLKDCLDQHGLPAGDPIGVSPVTLDGKDGIGALLGAGTEVGHYRIVVVEPDCASVLANSEVP